jgi:flagellar biosynthesis/type III secretory pathway protein FliH
MFEKEAGFAETKMLIKCNGDYAKKQDYKKGWQDGAEFGYNKANRELAEYVLNLNHDLDDVVAKCEEILNEEEEEEND